MPLISRSDYQPPGLLRNPHLNTLYAALFRRIPLDMERERLDTPDGDFLDIDWSRTGSRKLVVVLHGLEGHARRPYVKGMIRWFNQHGWDGVGMNFRGCSGEPNRKLHSYHLGATGDLEFVLHSILHRAIYHTIVLVGFSLGGNVVLKYVGESGDQLPAPVKRAVAFSVPCDVASCNREINRWHNYFYRWQFLRSMNEKILEKSRRFPQFDATPTGRKARSFDEYDEWYTAPVHGFAGARDYWDQSSCLRFLEGIRIPVLMISSLDDTFLSRQSYPYATARSHPYVYLETPRYGGHVGFVEKKVPHAYYSDRRALAFAEKLLNS